MRKLMDNSGTMGFHIRFGGRLEITMLQFSRN